MGPRKPCERLLYQGSHRRSALLERYRDSFEKNQTMEDGTFLLDASGSSIVQVCTLWDRISGTGVYGEGACMYLTGYDQTHVRVYHPESGTTEVCPWRRRTRCSAQRGMILSAVYRIGEYLKKNFTFFPDML